MLSRSSIRWFHACSLIVVLIDQKMHELVPPTPGLEHHVLDDGPSKAMQELDPRHILHGLSLTFHALQIATGVSDSTEKRNEAGKDGEATRYF